MEISPYDRPAFADRACERQDLCPKSQIGRGASFAGLGLDGSASLPLRAAVSPLVSGLPGVCISTLSDGSNPDKSACVFFGGRCLLSGLHSLRV